MIVLIALEILLICFVLLLKLYKDYKKKDKTIDYSNNPCFILGFSAVLILISGLRGDFTSDYQNYIDIYNYIGNQDFIEIIKNTNHNHTELLYNLLNKILYSIYPNERLLFLTIASLTVAFFVLAFHESSDFVGISIFLFVSTGLYFSSFNQMRVLLASSITFWGSRFIYRRKIFQYILVVLAAFFIHKTAILMLILLVIYPFRVPKKYRIAIPIFALGIVITTYLGIDKIVDIVTQYVYTAYAQKDAYGMQGLPITSLTVPVLILLNVFLLRKKIDLKNIQEKIWAFALVIYCVLSVACMRIEMFQWITFYFSPYTTLLIPRLICKQKPKKRQVFLLFLIVVFFIYSLCSSSAKLKYIFFWN